uniref:Uncharacterized protein n=1 Tax=Setaria digitata TaxID=48799 RepID=A0A915PT85_9BILA
MASRRKYEETSQSEAPPSTTGTADDPVDEKWHETPTPYRTYRTGGSW